MDKASRFRSARKNLGISQEELAARVGCAQSMVAKIESGATYRTKLLMDFARELNVRPEWLDSGKGPPRYGAGEQTMQYISAPQDNLLERIEKVAEVPILGKPNLSKTEKSLLLDLRRGMESGRIDAATVKALAALVRALIQDQ